jgi:hypothetical protein
LHAHSVLRLELDLQASLGLLRDHQWHRGVAAAVLGPATRRAVFEIGHDGPHCTLDVAIGFGAGDRGICAGLFPAAQRPPDVGWLAPDRCVGHYLGHTDFAKLWRAVEYDMAVVRDEDPAEFRADLRRYLGADVAEDVLAHVASDTLWFWASDPEDAPARSLFGNAGVVARLRDPAAPLPDLQPVLGRLGFFVEASTDDELWATRWPGVTVVVAHGVVCGVVGENRRQCIDQILERAIAGPPGPAVEATVAGAMGRGELQLDVVLERYLAGAWTLARLATNGLVRVPPRQELADTLERWLPRLRQNRLQRATTEVSSSLERWSLRLRW